MTTESTTFLRHIQLRILLNYRDLLIKLVDKVENKELFNNFSFFYDRLLNRGRRKIEKGLLEDFLIEIENNNSISDNAKEIFNQPDVDGGLVGGASLKADEFLKIINEI